MNLEFYRYCLKMRERLFQEIRSWNDSGKNDSFVDDNTLTVNVTRLRKKLESIGMTDVIRTKKGIGYLVEL